MANSALRRFSAAQVLLFVAASAAAATTAAGGTAPVTGASASGRGACVVELTSALGDPNAHPSFGYRVALDGDLAAVAAPTEGSPGALYGAVYLYRESGTGWIHEARLANDVAHEQFFGTALALGGSRLIVGRPGPPAVGTLTGAVDVYAKGPDGWSYLQTLTAPTPAVNDRFGCALFLDGDTLFVGSEGDWESATSGAVHVFTFADENWTHQQVLVPSVGEGGWFGHALTRVGDQLLIGAPRDDNGGAVLGVGAVYVWQRDGGSWAAAGKLTGTGTSGRFGSQVVAAENAAWIGARDWLYRFARQEGGAWTQQVAISISWFNYPSIDTTLLATHAGLPFVAGAFENFVELYQPIGDTWTSVLQFWAIGTDCRIGAALATSGDDLLIGGPHEWGYGPGKAWLVHLGDCNANGELDYLDLCAGVESDCNANGTLDACDVAAGTSPDCNANGVPDECDLASGTSRDCNADAIPDDCQGDCDGDGLWDACAAFDGTVADCNGNLVPDACELAAGTSPDCNANGVPDECDIATTFRIEHGPYPVEEAPRTLVIATPPQPYAGVRVEIEASANFDYTWFDVRLNGTGVGSWPSPWVDVPPCTTQQHVLIISRGKFDELTGGGPAVIDIDPVNPRNCTPPAWFKFAVAYEAEPAESDCNGNGVPDSCDTAAGEPDCNLNAVPDACDITGRGAGFDDPASWAAFEASQHLVGTDATGYLGAAFDGRYLYFAPHINDTAGQHGEVLRLDTLAEFGSAGAWTTFDPGAAGLGADVRGFIGPVFDGRYVYFAPYTSGNVLRYDTTLPFAALASWQTFAPVVAGIATGAAQYGGAAFDGRYVYFAPYQDDEVLRYDTTQPFGAAAAWTAFDTGAAGVGSGSGRFLGPIFDGRYVYFPPTQAFNTAANEFLRYDTTQDFTAAAAWHAFDPTVDGVRQEFRGGAYDGRYVYFAPFWHESPGALPPAPAYGPSGRVLRLDTLLDFGDPAAWAHFDPDAAGLGRTPRGFSYAVFDGRFVYFGPLQGARNISTEDFVHGEVLRLDTQADFFDIRSWDSFDAGRHGVGVKPEGYYAGAFDGQYVYFTPVLRDDLAHHGEVLRYDTLAGWSRDRNADGVPDECQPLRGDCDCDGAVTFGDIDYFVAAIPHNAFAWRVLHFTRSGARPDCDFANCDVNGNGHVGFDDIDPFVALLAK